MRILITGGTGYIGRNLGQYWSNAGHQVQYIVRPQSDTQELSINCPEEQIHIHNGYQSVMNDILLKAKPELVVHLASLYLGQHKEEDIQNLINSNIIFGNQILEAMAKNNITKFINTGTIWQTVNKETYNPINLYAATKQAFEDIIEYYAQRRNINSITLRLSDTYGPQDPRPKVLNLLLGLEKSDEILDMTGGEQLLSLVHIDDILTAYDCILKDIYSTTAQPLHRKYLVSAEQEITLKELVGLFKEVRGSNIKINWGKIPYRGLEMMESWKALPSPPGWKPTVDIKKEIKKL